MKILFLSAEVEPFAKVGGLADVAGSLPKALSALGHDLRTVMPAYGMIINDPKWGAQKVLSQIPVQLNTSKIILADLYEIVWNSQTIWLIDGNGYFGSIERSQDVYTPNREAYLFFSQAALELSKRMEWVPDIVHANDWHMAFAPVFLREKFDWPNTGSLYTIHNLAYQGEFGADTIEEAGLDWGLYNIHQLETYGGVNFLKSGCAFSDQVNTVSHQYSQEIQTPEFGCRLDGLMRHLNSQKKLSGILNGIDIVRHNPESDPRIPSHFSSEHLNGKKVCRNSILHEFGLELDDNEPLIGVISRLSDQKGFDLIIDQFQNILDSGAGLVILATGDPQAASILNEKCAQSKNKARFIEAYDPELAQRIYAGIDLFLMPSSFEPCGLGQMFAMRYGSVPIVRRTGGLADTVFEGINGFTFEERSSAEMMLAIQRAILGFRTDHWNSFVARCMTTDFSWDKSARQYETLYNKIQEARMESLVLMSRW